MRSVDGRRGCRGSGTRFTTEGKQEQDGKPRAGSGIELVECLEDNRTSGDGSTKTSAGRKAKGCGKSGKSGNATEA